MEYFILNAHGQRFYDLAPVHCGQEDCRPSHSFGPAVRDRYLLHLVTSGKGSFTILGKTYSVGAGEFFFIPPDTLNYYEADALEPWSYTWLGMKGELLPAFFERLGISAENPVGKFTPELYDVLAEILEDMATGVTASFAAVGRCYLFLSHLEKSLNRPESAQHRPSENVERATTLIDERLHKTLSVSALADELGLDRSYLCSIFKRELGCSPQQYILKRKIEQAKYFLSSTAENVKYIALSLGYDDPFVFSRAFKKVTGVSPSHWRETHGEKDQ